MAKISKKTKRLLFNLGFVALLVAVTLIVLFVNHKELNFDDIVNYFTNSNPAWIVAAFACMLLFLVFEGVSIFFIARFFGSKTSLLSSTVYSCSDAFYSAITPTAAGGQPAAVFYMSRDGMSPGKASFAMLLNTVGYTAAIFAIGVAAVCINPGLFVGIDTVFAKVLVIAGGVIQLGLLGLYIGCMFFGKAIIKLGNGIVTLLFKIKIVKKPEKWRKKIEIEVAKYGECRQILKEKPQIFLTTLLFNILQRVAQTLIPCFVCLAINPEVSFFDVFVLQAFVLFGYNSVPIPGGVGAYEYLFVNIYLQMFPDKAFILLALMISRLFSFYITIILSGVATLTYHMVKGKKVSEAKIATGENKAEVTEDGEETEQEQFTEKSDEEEIKLEDAVEEQPENNSAEEEEQ